MNELADVLLHLQVEVADESAARLTNLRWKELINLNHTVCVTEAILRLVLIFVLVVIKDCL